ncbi:hypothetical protein SEA_ROBSFEET_19 [Microbacterium phage RobsFeet]|uniref:Uncharacterized protein n=1 Tax=Microbacterium phage RobsFeet TaxID=2201442 RepID=A0A2Z4Q7F7_9CAUD|nr:hypothetical protein HOT43_gp19 [Microbacterium phage RobsFeet]AWY06026.1 hypothetical protein SEA_ROBSFEET_19 [Microbacterium phage RobsFeet]
MITIPEGMPRPSVLEVLASGGGGYQSVDLSDPSGAVVTSHRLEEVGHEPCQWRNPTWPDEAAGRLAAHLTTCVLR